MLVYWGIWTLHDGLPWPGQHCGEGTNLGKNEVGPRILWFSALSLRDTEPGWARSPGPAL